MTQLPKALTGTARSSCNDAIFFQVIPNADFVKPRIDGSHGAKIMLPGRDDAAEFDDTASTAELKGLVDDEVGLYFAIHDSLGHLDHPKAFKAPLSRYGTSQ